MFPFHAINGSVSFIHLHVFVFVFVLIFVLIKYDVFLIRYFLLYFLVEWVFFGRRVGNKIEVWLYKALFWWWKSNTKGFLYWRERFLIGGGSERK
jgi:hypothetical protein